MAIGVAFIGVGNISGIYLKNITTRFTEMKIVGLCDLVREKAEKAAAEYGIGKIYTDMYEAFDDPAVDLHAGAALCIFRSTKTAGAVAITVDAGPLGTQTIRLMTKPRMIDR